ncbi:MAG: hypothetical protein NXI35_38390 [bacterium]|nr:hypothetical protein [bacterium]
MSDLYVVTQLRIDGRQALWRVRPTTATNPTSRVATRSFVLAARALAPMSPVDSASALDLDWVQKHVEEYVERATPLGDGRSADAWPESTDSWTDEASALREGYEPTRASEDFLCERLPWSLLSIVVGDQAFFDGLPQVFGTAAYDVWWDDPKREPPSNVDPTVLRNWGVLAYRPPIAQRELDARLRVVSAVDPFTAVGLEGGKTKGYTSIDADLVPTSQRVMKSASKVSGLAHVANGVYLASSKRVTRAADGESTPIDAKSGALFRGGVIGVQAVGDEVAIGTTGGVSIVRGTEVIAKIEAPSAIKEVRAFYARSQEDLVLAGPKGVARIRGSEHVCVSQQGWPTTILPLDEDRTLIVEDERTWILEDESLAPYDSSGFGRPVASVLVAGNRWLVSFEGAVARWDGRSLVDARTFTIAPTRVSSAVADGDTLIVSHARALSRIRF